MSGLVELHHDPLRLARAAGSGALRSARYGTGNHPVGRLRTAAGGCFRADTAVLPDRWGGELAAAARAGGYRRDHAGPGVPPDAGRAWPAGGCRVRGEAWR